MKKEVKMPEIGSVDESTFCRLDCKFRDDPTSLTDVEVGLLIERGREENWDKYIASYEKLDKAYEKGYSDGYDEGHSFGM